MINLYIYKFIYIYISYNETSGGNPINCHLNHVKKKGFDFDLKYDGKNSKKKY